MHNSVSSMWVMTQASQPLLYISNFCKSLQTLFQLADPSIRLVSRITVRTPAHLPGITEYTWL